MACDVSPVVCGDVFSSESERQVFLVTESERQVFLVTESEIIVGHKKWKLLHIFLLKWKYILLWQKFIP